MIEANHLIKSLLLFLFVVSYAMLKGQTGCPSVDALSIDGVDSVTIDCDQPCVTIDAEVFETGSTESYVVESIPYAPPYPFNQGTSLFIGIDDIYSPAIALPFEFCFFGVNYNQIVVGSNGVISFDIADANAYCPWSFTASAPSAILPTNAIFGVYHDIDPSVCGAVRYQLLGEYPCRTFVVSYDAVCHFSCNNLISTSQVVFYETTNTIDVYVADKPTCGGWNSGNALIGIQNAAGTVAFVPPGRNTGSWSTSNEAWRFTPSGGAPTYTVTWYEAGVEIGTGNSIDVCPVQTTTYTATAVYDGCGGGQIEVSDDFTVNVDFNADELPNPTITNPVVDLCMSDEEYQFEAVDPGGDWSASCIGCISENGLFDVSGTGAGNYTISYTIDSDCGPLSNSVVLNVHDDANAAIEAIDPLCTSAGVLQLETLQAGGSWSVDDCVGCLDLTTGVFDPAVSGPGVFNVGYSISSVCPDSQQIEVEVVVQDDASFMVPDYLCENGEVVSLAAVQSGGVWTSDCGACIDSDGQFNPGEAGAGTYTVTYEFDSYCPDSQLQSIEVIGVEEPQISEEDDLCISSDPLVFVTSVEGGLWSADCGVCINQDTGSFDPTMAGVGTFTITYTIGDQCVVTDNTSISVEAQLDASITALDTLCTQGSIVQLQAADDGGIWSANCTDCIDPVSGAFDPGSVSSGNYTVNYLIPGLCGDNDQQQVIVALTDDPTILQPSDYCVAWGEVQLEVAQEGGYWSASCGNCIDSQSGIFNTALAGIGTHVVSYSFSGICGSDSEVNINVIPNDDSTIDEVYGFCIDEGIQQLTAASPGGLWTADCGNCITAQGLFSPSIAGVGVHTVTYSIPGPCGTLSSEDVEVFSLPQPSFSIDNFEGCVPFSVLFTQDSIQLASCQWNFGDGDFSADCGSVSHVYTSPGCYDVGLTLTSYDGCEASVMYTDIFCGLDNPESAFIYSPVAPTSDDPIIDLDEQAIGEIAWQWHIGSTELGTTPHLQYNMLDAGASTVDICLTVTDENACTDTFCRTIDLIEKLRVFVPNVFTPDGDGVNEVWFPRVLGAVSYEVVVFDRWGDVVFRSTTVGEPWLGGRQNGDYFVQDGLYHYILKVAGADLEVREYEGHVIILR